jgi:formylglycine-generating enzyme required for sulfatase activity/acetyl esterase/lipase
MSTPAEVEAIFFTALEKGTGQERDAYLDSVCSDDADLRARVQRLLEAHPRVGDFLARPAIDNLSALHPPEDTTMPHGDSEGALVEGLDFLEAPTRPGSLGRLGHYEVLEVLGRGGFGIVVKAFDEVLHRVVAIKMMAPQLATTSPARKRFLREARASAAVRHENVIAIHAIEEQPIPFLVMDFIAGETLQQRLDRTGPLDVAEVLCLGRQIALGLAAAHEKGLIHRDIKPSNILLGSGIEEAVKITDFGLARAADDASLTKSGVIVGTPMYMAPEQAQGELIDHRADLFSLGSVLYVMCSGRPPFRASTTLAVLKRVAEDTPRPIREIIPEVPEWLCAIVARLHTKKASDRFQTAREVADLLGRCFEELAQHGTVSNAGPYLATVDPAHEATVSAAPRRRYRFAAAVCTLVVLVVAAAAWFWPRGNNDSDDTNRPPNLAVAPFDAAQARAHQESWASHLGVAVEVENSIGMKLRLIPPGQFVMGSPSGEPGREKHEGPQHEVVLTRPFYMGVHDVTVGQFKAFVKETGYRTEAETDGGNDHLFPDGSWRWDAQSSWRNPGFEQTDAHPVVLVSWNDARAFCRWLSEKEGRRYTLPTEAQWEYACRAGSQSKFYFGDDDARLVEYAWYSANSGGKTQPVGQKKPNAWGLHDMHGNVHQWIADWYEAGYYDRAPKENPPGPRHGPVPLRRGGSWHEGAQCCRAAYRRGVPGNSSSNRVAMVGFRIVQVGELKSSVDSTKSPASAEVAGKTGFIERSYRDLDGAEHRSVVFVPHDYTGDKEYPVILFLHGAGSVKGRGRQPIDNGIGPAIKKQEATFPFITVIPQALRQSWQAGSEDGERALAILARVCRDYRTDRNRLYLTGLSLGGYGTWSLATRYPGKWAAIAPICGGGDVVRARTIKDLPCWCFHGERDTVVPVNHSRKMIAALRAAGGKPRYTEFPDVDHRCWDQVYANPELYEFFLANKRK